MKSFTIMESHYNPKEMVEMEDESSVEKQTQDALTSNSTFKTNAQTDDVIQHIGDLDAHGPSVGQEKPSIPPVSVWDSDELGLDLAVSDGRRNYESKNKSKPAFDCNASTTSESTKTSCKPVTVHTLFDWYFDSSDDEEELNEKSQSPEDLKKMFQNILANRRPSHDTITPR